MVNSPAARSGPLADVQTHRSRDLLRDSPTTVSILSLCGISDLESVMPPHPRRSRRLYLPRHKPPSRRLFHLKRSRRCNKCPILPLSNDPCPKTLDARDLPRPLTSDPEHNLPRADASLLPRLIASPATPAICHRGTSATEPHETDHPGHSIGVMTDPFLPLFRLLRSRGKDRATADTLPLPLLSQATRLLDNTALLGLMVRTRTDRACLVPLSTLSAHCLLQGHLTVRLSLFRDWYRASDWQDRCSRYTILSTCLTISLEMVVGSEHPLLPATDRLEEDTEVLLLPRLEGVMVMVRLDGLCSTSRADIQREGTASRPEVDIKLGALE